MTFTLTSPVAITPTVLSPPILKALKAIFGDTPHQGPEQTGKWPVGSDEWFRQQEENYNYAALRTADRLGDQIAWAGFQLIGQLPVEYSVPPMWNRDP